MGRKPNGASSIYKGADGDWHGRVTVGVKDDGRPDRRHIQRHTEAEVRKRVRELERERESGAVRPAGDRWTVGAWLTHWVDNIAAPASALTRSPGTASRCTSTWSPGSERTVWTGCSRSTWSGCTRR